MPNKRVVSVSSLFRPLIFWVVLVLILSENIISADWEEEEQILWGLGPLVKKNQRRRIISSESGDVSEARVTDGNEAFQLHFISLEPNSLFLPVLLHYDMVFYVQTGSGRLSYLDEDEKEHRRLRRGDVHRLRSGAVFFLQSDLETQRQKLRIIAIFDNPEHNFNDPASGPYSSIRDLLLGFDDRVLHAIFKAPRPVIEEIRNGTRPAAIIHGLQKKKNTIWETEYEFMEDMYNIFDFSNKHKKSKLFNIFSEDPDFKNCNGWSTTVNKKKYGPLKGSKYGIFMVNLTIGSMMGPHWNPMATEIAVVLQGKGMVHVVCPRTVNTSECKNSRYLVEEGDIFVVPRFHPMVQMAFNNETFVFMGFSTSIRRNHPQYLAGKASVLRTLDKRVMAASLAANVSTLDKFLDHQDESVILACISCAEEEWMRMAEEIEKERQREKEREEEAARKKEEEEAQRKREEEEARKKREEEEAWRRWEEKERERQERQREEEERERQEQEERERQERQREEEERKKQEQAERERQEQAERERQEQQREEEERKRQEQEEKERQEQEQREQDERKRQEQEEKERQEQEQREQEERERQEQQRRWEEEERKRQEQQREEAERQEQQREQAAAEEREQEQAREAERKETERQEQEQEQEERERQGQQHREQEAAAEEREQEQTREAEREREAQARREEEAAKEETAQGQGQWGEGQGVPEEKSGQEAETRKEDEAARQEAAERWEEAHGSGGRGQKETGKSSQESATAQEEHGGAQGWARRFLKKTA